MTVRASTARIKVLAGACKCKGKCFFDETRRNAKEGSKQGRKEEELRKKLIPLPWFRTPGSTDELEVRRI
jgi:hypothetical protein